MEASVLEEEAKKRMERNQARVADQTPRSGMKKSLVRTVVQRYGGREMFKTSPVENGPRQRFRQNSRDFGGSHQNEDRPASRPQESRDFNYSQRQRGQAGSAGSQQEDTRGADERQFNYSQRQRGQAGSVGSQQEDTWGADERQFNYSQRQRGQAGSAGSQQEDMWGADERQSNHSQRQRGQAGSAGSQQEDMWGAQPQELSREKKRRRDQWSIEEATGEEDMFSSIATDLKRKSKKKQRSLQRGLAVTTPLVIPGFVTVDQLAKLLKVRVSDFAHKLYQLGFDHLPHDHILTGETAGLIAMEYNFEPIIDESATRDLAARPPPTDPSRLESRPPVVTIMGHVDHGKTTILDHLRRSSIAAGEFGGITQHIGAFSVPMPSGKVITFLDTPGHAAFLKMRERGANVTDIVVLVVAADDSVKPQTLEAIKHARAAQVPMIVAVNKIDKPEADVERVKLDLARHGVELEDVGGDTQVVPVSGKTGQGMSDLEEALVTLSELMELRAEREGPAEGWVIEATTKTSGRVATILVRRGTVRAGNILLAGTTWGRIRAVRNEAGVEVESAGPGTPVEVDGWKDQPVAGDEVLEAPDEATAKVVVDYRLERAEKLQLASDMVAVNEARRLDQERRDQERQERIQREEQGGLQHSVTARGFGYGSAARNQSERLEETAPGPKDVYFIIKGDVSGSVEAVLNNVTGLGNDEVRACVLRSGVGPVSESDIEHVAAAGGHIIAFNTPVDGAMRRMADAQKVAIVEGNIIYRLMDDVKAKLSEYMLDSVTLRVKGEAEVAQIFEINMRGRTTAPVAGCKVRNGLIARNSKVRVLRGGETVYEGTLSSLKNVKKDVTEMRKGAECGMSFEKWVEFRIGDQVQCVEEIREKRMFSG